MQMPLPDDFIKRCAAVRGQDGFVPLDMLFAMVPVGASEDDATAQAMTVAQMFNGSNATRSRMRSMARTGNTAAANLDAWMTFHGIHPAPCHPIAQHRAATLESAILSDPVGFLARADQPYPYSVNDQHWGFEPAWINRLLVQSRPRLSQFTATLRGDMAILVGNGPSLNHTDLSLLDGHDVYISNYAIKHPVLSQAARGVAVTNYFVAEQAPEDFFALPQWRVLPVGLSHVFGDDGRTIWLNALGGPLFFSRTPQTHIAWHATVSFFWMQFLLAVGYKKLLLIGVDNSYQQPKSMREGTLIQQIGDDQNHFDATYFKGKVWQAADTDHMAQTYALAKSAFEQAGSEIVNCTVGGALEVFRRSTLETEL